MKDVLHTTDLGIAEALRVALLAEGIDSSVRRAAFEGPAELTVSVHHDAQYEQAVRIRQDIESHAAQDVGSTRLRPGLVLAVVVIVLGVVWWLVQG